MKNVSLITLGCDKNRVDSERMLYLLSESGYTLTNDYDEADIMIVNTCAFIESARQEAIDTILAAAEYKKNKLKKLIVAGCLTENNSEVLYRELPEVDAFISTKSYDNIVKVIDDISAESDEAVRKIELCDSGIAHTFPRIQSTPAHYAYLKISDGCDNHCTFCTIPSIRGAYRSYGMDGLIKEAERLSDNGVKELILVAQDVTRYGTDFKGSSQLVPLLKKLSEFDFEWIRLMYCYPELVTDELLDEIDSNPKIAKYIDVPLQHISDNVLKTMNRRIDRDKTIGLIERIRSRKSGIAIRTTLMTGFPTETESDFKELLSFLKTYKPDHAGIFAYSMESGTPAAKLGEDLPVEIKKYRADKLGMQHLKNARKLNRAKIGTVEKVIYEDIDYDKGMFVGRTQASAPEIDSLVYFKADSVEVGEFYDVRITGYKDYDLFGVVENKSKAAR